ncbi:hypothetical protein [Limnohabitans sp. DM1]|nr:hypothetical protein [Limnohabitans sp. DM1]
MQRRGTPQQPADLLAHDLITGDRNNDIETALRRWVIQPAACDTACVPMT